MDRGSQLDEEDDEEEERRRGEEEQATDIKPNNPHLAGGEFQMQKMNPKQALVPACLDHDNLFLAVVMVMKDAPCTES